MAVIMKQATRANPPSKKYLHYYCDSMIPSALPQAMILSSIADKRRLES
jgi:hypothetical protein